MKVLYFDEKQLFATSSIAPWLRQIFGQNNVQPIRPGELRPSLLKDVDILVMPGIAGESSPYPRILPPEKAELIYRKMEQDGLQTYVECASFYWASENISYERSDGRQLRKEGLGWISGLAKNVGRGLALDKDFRYADTVPTDIEFYDNEETHYTSICISNGPALHLNEAEKANPDVRITARFVYEEGQPVASMTKIIGNGMLIGMGVLPHIKTKQLAGHCTDPGRERHRAALFNRIAANEDGITRYERTIFNHIQQHQETLHAHPA